MAIEKILHNNTQWVQLQLQKDSRYFEKLSAPQKPSILYIGCSDSRVLAEDFMGVGPGEVFVHRNIANIVSSEDKNIMSVIQYAVHHLHISHIIVCGHYGCGGVKAAMNAQADVSPKTVLDVWLNPITHLYEQHRKTLLAIADEEARYKKLLDMHVEKQCHNIVSLPMIKEARMRQSITVHGLVFDIRSGILNHLVQNCNEK